MKKPVSEPKTKGKKAKPLYVATCNNVSVPILKNGRDRVVITWRQFEGGERKRETFARSNMNGEKGAKARADEIARSIANSLADVVTLSSADRDNYRIATQALAPLGIPLAAAIEEYVAAKKSIPGHTLLEATTFFNRGFVERRICPPTLDILAKLLAQLRDDRRDEERYVKPLKKDLEKFGAAFPDLQLANEDSVREYLRGLKTSKAKRDRETGEVIPAGAPVSARRRDNVRDAIVLLMRFARKKEFLPPDKTSAAEHIAKISEGHEVTTYAPEQVSKILAYFATQDPDWFPWAAIQAFAGLRSSEVLRLQWERVRWDEQYIAVSSRVARKVKTSRKPPILPVLAQMLAPWRGKSDGFVIPRRWKHMNAAHTRAIAGLKKALGWSVWDTNALRHSFGSNRLGILKDIAKVAHEMGNSPGRVREDYNNPKSEAEALAYFSIQPPTTLAKVIPFVAA